MPVWKWLLNNFDSEKDIGVAMSDKNLPGTPQCEKLDFFRLLIIFDTSIGEDALMVESCVVFGLFSKCGTQSSGFATVALLEK